MLVDSSRLQRREHVPREKFLAEIFHHHLGGAGGVGFRNYGFNVVSLADIAHHRNHIVGIIFSQPRNNDGGVETSRIGKYDFLRHEPSSLAIGFPRPAINTKWLSERAAGFPLDRTRPIVPSPVLRR